MINMTYQMAHLHHQRTWNGLVDLAYCQAMPTPKTKCYGVKQPLEPAASTATNIHK